MVVKGAGLFPVRLGIGRVRGLARAAAHIVTTSWILSHQHRAVALLYHWRLLPRRSGAEGVFALSGGLDGAVAHWEGSAAVRDRLQARARLVFTSGAVPRARPADPVRLDS